MDWVKFIEKENDKDYFIKLMGKIKEERENYTIYPSEWNTLEFIKYSKMDDIKVVILGQDPYHQPQQAHGLAFSVNEEVKIPPSLRNIYKELNEDLGIKIPNHGNLAEWASQGVLLLNTVLTVRANSANSHKGYGWETFTDAIISEINSSENPVVFILWGKEAQKKTKLITGEHHLILTAAHPSPLSASKGFFGCKHFSKTNSFLESVGRDKIDWSIEDIDKKEKLW